MADLVDPAVRYAEQSDSLHSATIPTLICPSRTYDTIIKSHRGAEGPRGDYIAMSSTYFLEGSDCVNYDGAIIYGDAVYVGDVDTANLETWRSRTSFSNITDGLAKTFLISEASFGLAVMASTFDGDMQGGAILGDREYPEEFAGKGLDGIADAAIEQYDGQDNTWVGSSHPEVMHVTMADGSSRPIRKDNNDLRLLEHLVTRAGGESTSLADLDAN